MAPSRAATSYRNLCWRLQEIFFEREFEGYFWYQHFASSVPERFGGTKFDARQTPKASDILDALEGYGRLKAAVD